MLNQAPLKTLKVQEDHVGDILDEARNGLIQVTSNPDMYREVFNKLILKSILQVCNKIMNEQISFYVHLTIYQFTVVLMKN